MKKFFLTTLAAALCLPFYSCLDSASETVTGVEGGVALYNLARFQIDMDMDPMILALKLNTLMETADQQFEDWSVAKVTIGEDDDATEVLLLDQLFGEGNSVKRNGDEWILMFQDRTTMEKEKYYRDGEVVINTNGYRLGDLLADPSASWEVTVAEGGYNMVMLSGDNFVNRLDYYTITGDGSLGNTWVAEGRSTSYYVGYESQAASWPFAYEVYFPGEASFYFNDILNSQFLVNADIQGRPVLTDYEVRYEAIDLKYKPRCAFWFIFGGMELVEVLNRSSLSVEDFPELYVKYAWFDQSATTDCYYTVEISYNGTTITL
ncbi:MAG: hypothetical protein LUF87_09940 [Alistipes sp.]|nr:hypothetical protein [Alistipes sp.]